MSTPVTLTTPSLAGNSDLPIGLGNPLQVVEPDCLAIPSVSVTSATTLFTQDMMGYESTSVQVTSAGSGCTITYETSDDNTNWVSSAGINSIATSVASTTSSTTILLTFPKRGRYFRARVSTYGSGTVTVVGNLHKNPQPMTNRITVDGPNASGATPSNMFSNGVRAYSANPAAVTNAQTQYQIGTLVGAAIIKPYSIPEADWQYAAAASGIVNTTTAVTLKAAGAAGIKNYLTGIDISTDGALGAATEVVVRDGAAGTVIYRIKIGTSGLAAGRFIQFFTPLQGTAATLMEVATLTASVTGAVYINAQGYQAP